jgi:exonuclease III
LIRILNWNIRQGGGKRIGMITAAINDIDPDIAILTEFRNNLRGNMITKHLKGKGLCHNLSLKTSPKINTILISSKWQFKATTFDEELLKHSHRSILAEFADFALFAYYFPQKLEKIPLYEFFLNKSSQYLNKPSLLIGDFNTGIHYKDEIGATFKASDYFEKFSNTGWIDAWRHFNGDKREYSWYSKAGNGFRIDHCFVSPPLLSKLRKVYYDHSLRRDKYSDHSAMIMELDY